MNKNDNYDKERKKIEESLKDFDFDKFSSQLYKDKTQREKHRRIKYLLIQILGVSMLLFTFFRACVQEDVFNHGFTKQIILDVLIAMVKTIGFWIGLVLEEFGRRVKKKIIKELLS